MAGIRRTGSWRRLALWVVAGLLLLIAAVRYGPRLAYLLRHTSTDDAYVHGGTIVPIVPQVGGRVVELHVDDNQDVERGSLLLVIDPSDYQVALARAQAELARRQATLENAQQVLRRSRPLQRHDVLSEERLDEATAAERESEAAVAMARAEVARAHLDLERTRIAAPVAGRVTQRNVHLGSIVGPGDALFALVDLRDVWVVANFKETQIGEMRLGQPADLELDAYPGRVFHGHVASFQAATGSVTSLLPPENATGQFVKIVQRLPVRIDLDDPPDPSHPLYPGLSVIVHVDTHAAPPPRAATRG